MFYGSFPFFATFALGLMFLLGIVLLKMDILFLLLYELAVFCFVGVYFLREEPRPPATVRMARGDGVVMALLCRVLAAASIAGGKPAGDSARHAAKNSAAIAPPNKICHHAKNCLYSRHDDTC